MARMLRQPVDTLVSQNLFSTDGYPDLTDSLIDHDILIGEGIYLQVRDNIVASGPEEITIHPHPPLVVYRLEGLR